VATQAGRYRTRGCVRKIAVRVVARRTRERFAALNKTFGSRESTYLVGDQQIVRRGIRKLGKANMTLRTNCNAFFATQSIGIDDGT
jgi:hypothetical protein